jgi:hypothetical protein
MDPKEASESVAERFTRVMKATPSPIGPWCDLMAASVISGIILAVGLFVIRRSSDSGALYRTLAFAAAPLAVSALLSTTLGGSRAAVVRWLASLPFPVENVNALLAGLGDTLEVYFESGADLPTRASLQPKLDEISDDILLVKERPDERSLEIRLGVIDSKRMPLVTNHRRWTRLVTLVDKTFVPLSKTTPIRKILVV